MATNNFDPTDSRQMGAFMEMYEGMSDAEREAFVNPFMGDYKGEKNILTGQLAHANQLRRTPMRHGVSKGRLETSPSLLGGLANAGTRFMGFQRAREAEEGLREAGRGMAARDTINTAVRHSDVLRKTREASEVAAEQEQYNRRQDTSAGNAATAATELEAERYAAEEKQRLEQQVYDRGVGREAELEKFRAQEDYKRTALDARNKATNEARLKAAGMKAGRPPASIQNKISTLSGTINRGQQILEGVVAQPEAFSLGEGLALDAAEFFGPAARNLAEGALKTGEERDVRSALTNWEDKIRNSLFGSQLTKFEGLASEKWRASAKGLDHAEVVRRMENLIEAAEISRQEYERPYSGGEPATSTPAQTGSPGLQEVPDTSGWATKPLPGGGTAIQDPNTMKWYVGG